MIFIACSPEEHAAIRTRVDYFKLETHRHEKWMGLLTGECNVCGSTIGLHLCRLCNEPMPTADQLPWGNKEDQYAHVQCVMETMLAAAKTKFVIYIGGGKAVELARPEPPVLTVVRE